MWGSTRSMCRLANPERVPALLMADTTGRISDTPTGELRAEGETSLAGANPPPRTYARHFPQEQPAQAFLYGQIHTLNPPRREVSVPGPTAEQVRALQVPTLLIVGEHDVIAPPAIMKMFQSYIPHARLAEVA